MHAIRNCVFASDIWNHFINEEEWFKFFILGSSQWLEANLKKVDFGLGTWQWPIVFAVVVYMIWQNRNAILFSGNPANDSQLLLNIMRQVDLVNSSISHPSHLPDNHPKHETQVSWSPPIGNSLKLNSDGSHNHSSELSAYGGVI